MATRLAFLTSRRLHCIWSPDRHNASNPSPRPIVTHHHIDTITHDHSADETPLPVDSMAGAVRVPEMSIAPHHEKLPFTIDTRRPSDLSTSQISPAGTLSPFLKQDRIYPPQKVYFSPTRDSFGEKGSISEASNAPSSPSSASSIDSTHESRAQSDHAASSRYTDGHHSSRHSRQSHRTSRNLQEPTSPAPGLSNPRRSQGPSTVISDLTTVTYAGGYDQQEERRELEAKAVRFLVCFSFQLSISWLSMLTHIRIDIPRCRRDTSLHACHRLHTHLPCRLRPRSTPSSCQDKTLALNRTRQSFGPSPTPPAQAHLLHPKLESL